MILHTSVYMCMYECLYTNVYICMHFLGCSLGIHGILAWTPTVTWPFGLGFETLGCIFHVLVESRFGSRLQNGFLPKKDYLGVPKNQVLEYQPQIIGLS